MNIGDLNKRITVCKQIFAEDIETGAEEPTSPEEMKLWANISPRTGSLLTGRDAGTMLAQTTHVITVRSRGDIKKDAHIIWKDEFGADHRFDIDYILPPAGKRFMMIYARETK